MAIMKLTAFNGGLKGSIAGTIFQGGKYGQVARTKVRDAISEGAKLMKADAGLVIPWKRNFTTISTTWRTLAPHERTSWSTAAPSFPFTNKFGEVYTPSGFQLFMSLNMSLLNSGEMAITTAPLPGVVVAGPSFEVIISPMDGTINLTSFSLTAGQKYRIDATHAISPGALVKGSYFKAIGFMVDSDTPPFSITSMYYDVFGVIPSAGAVWFRLTPINVITGQQGTPSTYCFLF
jgi:hypothetical protein